MNVLFLMSNPGHARNFESTLRALAERGHDVHMAFERLHKRGLPRVRDLSDQLVAEYPGMTSGPVPRLPNGDWSLVSSGLYASVDYMRYLGPEFSQSPKLRQRAQSFAPPRVRRLVSSLPPRGRAVVRRAFVRTARATPVGESVRAYLRERDPDVILVTPLVEPGSYQSEFLRAADELGIPTCHCVASWDNLTSKGLIHVMPDMVTVWNEAQRHEAVRFHGVPSERVTVTGAVPYDHWFGWSPSRSREQFAAAAGLDPSRPFLLYVGSSPFIAPDEAAQVVDWIRELGRHGLRDVQVLVRPHPQNPIRGGGSSTLQLGALDSVSLYPPAGADPTDLEAREDYFDSIYHSSAVVGVNTSAFLEAAIVGRAVFTALAGSVAETQRGLPHFHHLLTAGGGLLNTAENYEQHSASLRRALAAPPPEGRVSERSRGFVGAFIRPFGLDEPATPRLVAAIERLAEREKQPARAVRDDALGRALGLIARREMEKEARRRARARLKRDQGAAIALSRRRTASGAEHR
jgi:hypothetical protein